MFSCMHNYFVNSDYECECIVQSLIIRFLPDPPIIFCSIEFALGHSKLNYWFTSRDGGVYGLGGRNIIIIVNVHHVITMNMII